jgi:large conductance mechanosensitive channel
MGIIQEFKEFAVKGNVVDMAVGIIIGGAFGTIANSLVSDVLMPPIGLLIQGVNFEDLYVVIKDGAKAPPPYETLALAKEAGAVTVNYGMFITKVISFLLVAFAVFLLVEGINRLKRAEEKAAAPATPTTKPCPYCVSEIPIKATRCPNCTSEVGAGVAVH